MPKPRLLKKNVLYFTWFSFAGVPPLQRVDREDGRRLLQPHDVRGVRGGVLLALHEGDFGPALPQSVRVHILGEEAMVRRQVMKLVLSN